MITWSTTDLLAINMRALIAEHGDCGSDAKGCAVCDIIETDRIVLAAESDHRKPQVRGPVSQADQWPVRDHEYDGRGRNHG
jgi:hypothetical protein